MYFKHTKKKNKHFYIIANYKMERPLRSSKINALAKDKKTGATGGRVYC